MQEETATLVKESMPEQANNTGPRTWPSLLGCCDNCVPSCLMSFFFYLMPCYMGQIASYTSMEPDWIGSPSPGREIQANGCQSATIKYSVAAFASGLLVYIFGGVTGRIVRAYNEEVYLESVFCHSFLDSSDTCLANGCIFISNGPSGVCIAPTPAPTIGYYIVNALWVVPFAFGVWWFVMQLNLRLYLKQRFPPAADSSCTDFVSCGEGCCADCLTIFFCYPCALAQEGRLVFDYDKHPEFQTCSPFTDPGPQTSLLSTEAEKAVVGYQEQTIVNTTVAATPVVQSVVVNSPTATVTATATSETNLAANGKAAIDKEDF